jgi:hypothetical protein
MAFRIAAQVVNNRNAIAARDVANWPVCEPCRGASRTPGLQF